MKKLISFTLIIALLLTMFTVLISAETEELLENGDFELGDETNFKASKEASQIEFDGAYAHSGEYGMLVFEREDRYSTMIYDITDIVTQNGPGDYKASVWIKGSENSIGDTSYLVIKYRVNGEDTKDVYLISNKPALKDEWQECIIEGKIEYDQIVGLKYAQLYVQSYDHSNEAYEPGDVISDDYSLVKTSEVNGIKNDIKPIDVSREMRDEKTSIGAIRWDAWYGHDGVEGSIISQVEKTLSPKEYHFRAPFFAKVTDEGNITIPEYTQEIFDKEMEYAIDAGIDYFAYVWYNTEMRKARDFHALSKYKEQVKLCVCFDDNAIGQEYARNEMETLLTESYYMTVLDGRPLMYYYATETNISAIKRDIQYYRELCEKINVKAPYAVIMNATGEEVTFAIGDAISRYSVAMSGNKPFSELAQRTRNYWVDWSLSSKQYVPIITSGWHVKTRYDNPVSWTDTPKDHYVQYASNEELTSHISDAISYMNSDISKKCTMANTAIIFAWNEHDEGGWICPTIAVDENGNQLFNDDGTPKINDERLQAVKKAIKGDNSLTSSNTTPSPLNEELQENAKINLWMIISLAEAVIIIGLVAIILVKKKK